MAARKKEMKAQVRHRTRAPVVMSEDDVTRAELNAPIVDDVPGSELPDDLSHRIRVLAANRSAELMPHIYDTLYRMRLSGMTWGDIAHRAQVTERTVYRWWRKAEEFVKNRHTSLDPAMHFSKHMEDYKVRRERLVALLLSTRDPNVMATLSGALDRVDASEKDLLNRYGYFDLFSYGKMDGSDVDSAEARADMVRKGLFDAFDDGGDAETLQPVATEGNEDEDAVVVADEMDDWPDD